MNEKKATVRIYDKDHCCVVMSFDDSDDAHYLFDILSEQFESSPPCDGCAIEITGGPFSFVRKEFP
jgi:hypothetical protein